MVSEVFINEVSKDISVVSKELGGCLGKEYFRYRNCKDKGFEIEMCGVFSEKLGDQQREQSEKILEDEVRWK